MRCTLSPLERYRDAQVRYKILSGEEKGLPRSEFQCLCVGVNDLTHSPAAESVWPGGEIVSVEGSSMLCSVLLVVFLLVWLAFAASATTRFLFRPGSAVMLAYGYA